MIVGANIAQQWDDLKNKTVEAIRSYWDNQDPRLKLASKTRELVLHGIHVDESKVADGDIKSQEEAKHNETTWGARVMGDISLVDKATGKTIDRAKVKLLTLPKPTERYTYILGGNEVQIQSLWRLKSGVYAHQQENGELKTEFNLAKPFAGSPRINVPFDPQTRKFKFNYQATNVPLYPVLRALGVSDATMKKEWGEEIYKANLVKDPDKSVLQLYERMRLKGQPANPTPAQAAQTIAAEFAKTKLLPDTAKITLGKPIEVVDGEALLLGSKRIVSVARGDIKPDNRDSLLFKSLHGVDDFVHTYLSRTPSRAKLVNRTVSAMEAKDKKTSSLKYNKVADIIGGSSFEEPVNLFFSKSSLAVNPEQINPLEIISNFRTTTSLGGDVGGIKSDQGLTRPMKLIDPSHLGFLDPIHTPEGGRTGISLRLPISAKKVGNEIKTPVYDMKTGKTVHVSPGELHSEHVVFPDQIKWKNGKPVPVNSVVRMKDPSTHETVEQPLSKGRYVLYSPMQVFDETSNLIPFLQNNQGNRAGVASKMFEQAIPLAHREAPLVQVSAGGGTSLEHAIGQPWTRRAPISGTVTKIVNNPINGHADEVHIKDDKGGLHKIPLYNHFPLNDKESFFHNDVKVSVGQKVEQGHLLADSNFTKNGTLAVGTNMKVAYTPYKGYNYNDGIVISQSAASKLSSQHVHRLSLELDPDHDVVDKRKFMFFAGSTSKVIKDEQIAHIGDDGVVKVGAKVKPGGLLVTAVGKPNFTLDEEEQLRRVDKRLLNQRNRSIVWDSLHEGEVVKVVKNPNGKKITVFVKTHEPIQEGDKLVGRHGNKGIVTKILPDHEMPHTKEADGKVKPVDILLNPSGVPTRINIGQMLETAASKIALKTGKPYMVENFAGHDYTEKVKKDLAQHGLSDKEPMFDDKGQKLGDVLAGHQYILKLKHVVDHKLSYRGFGGEEGYSVDIHQPTGTGSARPGQAVGQLDLYALMAHGAKHTLKEMATYKSDMQTGPANDVQGHMQFWERVMTGQPLPPPNVPFVYQKFEALLKGAGINVHKDGSKFQLIPFTDSDVRKLSHGALKDAGKGVRAKNLKEILGGLFDPKLTGGLPTGTGRGLNWTHLELPEPVPNPIFVGTRQRPGPLVVLTGLKFDEFENIARAKTSINGKTAGLAIEEMLKKIDVKKEIADLQKKLPDARGHALDQANRKMKFLIALDQTGKAPHEVYMQRAVPVLPPVFRPLTRLPDGSLRPDDLNFHYRNLAQISDQLRTFDPSLPEEKKTNLRRDMYEAMKVYTGLRDKNTDPLYDSNRKVKGILDIIRGGEDAQSKTGLYQKAVVKKRQDLSMRSTIIVGPDMALDQIGLPREAAFEIYKPFVIRELSKLGYNYGPANKALKERTPAAAQALEKVMSERPVLAKRDPVLHKFGFMAFKPKIVEGRAIQLHPLATGGFNADFDGDTMSAFVPLHDDAVKEAHKLFPSNLLFSSTNFGVMHTPDQEMLHGLHLMAKWGKETPHAFKTVADAHAAEQAGKIKVNDVVTVAGKKTTLGRMLLLDALPSGFKSDDKFVSKLMSPHFELVPKPDEHGAAPKDVFQRLAKESPKDYPVAINKLKDLGNHFATRLAPTLTLDDLHVDKQLRSKVLAPFDAEVAKIKASTLDKAAKDAKIVETYTKANNALEAAMKDRLKKVDNGFYSWHRSGARGSLTQVMQITAAPMLVSDAQGRTVPVPIRRSYSEGLDLSEYWTASHGARAGALGRSEESSQPGAMSKDIMNTMTPVRIVDHDCRTSDGISLRITDPSDAKDLHGRFLAKDIKLGNNTIKSGTVVDSHILSTLQKHKIDQVIVRSPLNLQHGSGLCSKCYGINENGQLHEPGTNIGVIAGQSMGEPMVNLAMKTFHTGGTAAGGKTQTAFAYLRTILHMPEITPDPAVLSTVTGKVTKIEKDPVLKGHYVHVDGIKQEFIPPHKSLINQHGKPLEVGMSVRKGDAFTDGIANPYKVLHLTGDIHRVQNNVVDDLYKKIFEGAGVRRRNIETVVRSTTNLTKVTDPGDSPFLHGDVVKRTELEKYNRELGPGKKAVAHMPILKHLTETALDQHEDWLARLNYRKQKNTLLEGVAKGWVSDTHGTSPLPWLVTGGGARNVNPTAPHHW